MSTPLKTLIIGGSGFLSGTLVRCALREGHRVWTLTRGQRALPDGATPIIADRKDRAAFSSAIAAAQTSWDLVVDCIGFSAGDAAQDIECFTGRAAAFVFISTDCVITPIDRPWKIDETYSRFHDSPYGRGKRDAEEIFLSAGSKLPWTILRPCHIYGPGSQLGCIPIAARDPQLLPKLLRHEPITLVGAGHFLQHPVFAEDLWKMSTSCLGNPRCLRQIYFSPGPDIVESRVYYHHIADHLGVSLAINEVAIADHLRENPGNIHFCCHRVYDTTRAAAHGLTVPATPLRDGLKIHVDFLRSQLQI
jgi:nucleoside-diphosphate-sugar epimerase